MPNRIIKETICRSDTIDQLSWFEEVLFYRLMVNCDDYGRFDARPAIIKGSLFPLKNVSEKHIITALNKFSDIGLVVLYEHNERQYIQCATWNNHQQIRSKKSKYPEPENICNQMISDDIKCPRNPIQSNPNTESNPNALNARFDSFWKSYPRKTGKGEARRSFEKLKVGEPLLADILKAIERQKASDQWKRDGGRYIPNPSTWLNQGRWEDELPKQKTGDFEQREYSAEHFEKDRLESDEILNGFYEENTT